MTKGSDLPVLTAAPMGREEAEALGYKAVTLKPSRGRRLDFMGKLIADAEWSGQAVGVRMAIELWETPAGAWIAVSRQRDGSGRRGDAVENAWATVIPPGDDLEARQDAAMDQWDWHNRARSMVREQLGWRLSRTVA